MLFGSGVGVGREELTVIWLMRRRISWLTPPGHPTVNWRVGVSLGSLGRYI